MKQIFLILFGIHLLGFATAQDFKLDYLPVKNEGKVPKDLLSSSTNKYNSVRSKKSSKSKIEKKSVDDFFLVNSFAIDELLHSGRVNFSDPITQYVQSVADELLKNDKKLRKKLKFYTVRSAVTNAFATDRGIIFINLGLLAKLENEAQLAFILSHEISHFQKKHSLKSKINFDKIEKDGKKLAIRKSNKVDVLFEQSNYSKKIEIEADKLGAKRFLNTEWDVNGMKGAFDVLDFAHIPFRDIKVENDFLNLDKLIVPSNKFKKKVKKIKPNSKSHKRDSDYHSHPGLDERRKAAEKYISKMKTKKGIKSFVVSEEKFKLAKKQSQFEICNVLVQNQQYVSAIYHSYSLLDLFPNNDYLRRIFTYSLYGLAQNIGGDPKNPKKQKYALISEPVKNEPLFPFEKDIEGEIQQVYHVFNKLSKNEINLIAARHIWDYQKNHKDDEGMELMRKDMIEDLVIYQVIDSEKFTAKAKKKSKSPSGFAERAFVDIVKDKAFKKMVKDGQYYFDKMDDYSKPKESFDLNMKSVTFLDPLYLKFGKKGIMYLKSEKKQKQFVKQIKAMGKKVGIKTSIIGTHSLGAKSSIDDFNDFILLKNWANELMGHRSYMINSNYNEVQHLSKKYKSKSIAITGNFVGKEKTPWTNLVFGIFPSFTPYVLYNYFQKNSGIYFTFVLDLEKNSVRMNDVHYYRQKDRKEIIDMNLYWSLMQLKSNKK